MRGSTRRTPVKAALTGVAVNVVLKIVLVGALAQVGLALATAAGAWVNLLLVMVFAVRAGYLEIDRAWVISSAKFVIVGLMMAAALWGTARFCAAQFATMTSLRDEVTLGVLIVVGAIVYGVLVLALFGPRWLRRLVRG